MSNVLPIPADNRFSAAGDRDHRGKFISGPGNIGRRVGSKNKASRELMQQVRKLGPDAVAQLTTALRAGERWSVELVLKYCLPQARTVEFDDGEMTPETIRNAFADGDLSSQEVKDVATAMAKLGEVEELTALRERISELEALIKQQTR